MVARNGFGVTLQELCLSYLFYKVFISYLKDAVQLLAILFTLSSYFIASCCKPEYIQIL